MATAVSISVSKGEQDSFDTHKLTIGTSAPGTGDYEFRMSTGATTAQALRALEQFKFYLTQYGAGQKLNDTGAGSTVPGV